ncbi:hypothetical protein Taro_048951 [Colocasia esculenta]|uniref:Uncharacterized protein n=1 Tax=Colocasia esculenta TaxID=4460 RepID=A0A843X9G9_COLES|nr:hypothetical protein [Colocasia esculenta]
MALTFNQNWSCFTSPNKFLSSLSSSSLEKQHPIGSIPFHFQSYNTFAFRTEVSDILVQNSGEMEVPLELELLPSLEADWVRVHQAMPSLRLVSASWCPKLEGFPITDISFKGGSTWVMPGEEDGQKKIEEEDMHRDKEDEGLTWNHTKNTPPQLSH